MVNIVTHNARFHSDEIFGCAVLLLVFPDVKIARTRDRMVIAKADIVLDVGDEYNPAKNRFDHHQEGGAGCRGNGVPYASFGLIWKHFGDRLVSSRKVFEHIDEKLVQPIDAMDNGVDLYKAYSDNLEPYLIQSIVSSFHPTWREDDSELDQNFRTVLDFVKKVLQREIKQAEDFEEGKKYIEETYKNAVDKRLLVLDRNYSWGELVANIPEVLYVVRPNPQDGTWKLQATRDDVHSYKLRKPMPESWAGKRGEELAAVSGVPDTIFCHNGRFVAGVGSKEGAIALANKAISE
ncbi:MAG: hypothetical protein A3E94_01295 [Candidatus Zambryskibacteria bacterium RIFCSPHIGHO2_12_FULL_44_12b]|uniref:Metal-dependent hydrolase n=1 Tax=Candidatus Zambryskibacteria bacterium RIFCSPLOWO2_01_FULL_45_21 TaxID=1802761 RepID=A0A1G2U1R8_9BACT|nr:MAG: hypothetical protein A3E94_01295 [Candidatus Zambryskibacteria bacterium RIFCSPHIGHO2_12_FULL_44_12b]OHB03468.1 MAG: hypothetical protein A3B14_02975 [Candidatus Zambryskibacteria bacterium RIFCSPLOWO2_01_FULL_45_21]